MNDRTVVDAYWRLRYLEMAELEGVVLDPLPQEYGMAFSFKNVEQPDWPEIHLSRMLVNWRIQESVGLFYGRYWCYASLSDHSFINAIRALKEWQGDPNAEPAGWIKAWDGRRG